MPCAEGTLPQCVVTRGCHCYYWAGLVVGTVLSHGPMRNIGFLGRWGTHACPQCLPSGTVPIRSWTRTLRRPGIRHRHLPYHTMPYQVFAGIFRCAGPRSTDNSGHARAVDTANATGSFRPAAPLARGAADASCRSCARVRLPWLVATRRPGGTGNPA